MPGPAAKRARFVFLTDTHFHPNAAEDFGAPKMLTRGREVLDATVPTVNALAADFIVHGGDLLCGGGSFDMPLETYLESLDEVARVYDGFAAPAYYVPGNHDCDAEDRSFEAFTSRFGSPQPIHVAHAAPGLGLALANLYANSDDGVGLWSPEHDQQLRAAASAAGDDGTALILVLHEWVLPNFLEAGDNPGRGQVRGADILRQTLSDLPAVVAVFTGHRHINRITCFRDFAVIDTACLIGFPLGLREITLDSQGYLTSRFHVFDLPNLLQASRERSSTEVNNVWQGEVLDRDATILLPRLREIWS